MIKAIAIDDEPPALKVIEAFCADTGFITLEKTFTKPAEAQKYLNKFPVDLLFLDIQMPSQTGIEFYKTVKQDTMAIFTTAHSEYAVEGFNLNAVDYLLKPFTYERFLQATTKANDYYNYRNNTGTRQEQYLFIRADYRLVKINVADILYIEGLDDYIKIFIKDQKTVVARMTMKHILEKLPSKEFLRVHRSFIVSLARIDNVRNKIIYTADKEIPVGGIYEDDFFSQFKK
ncbi:MAG: DNA-binding response regulator [Bacteroidetes bacterium]|nr:DNA-binding response regulator [Bacteroidota bacterium]